MHGAGVFRSDGSAAMASPLYRLRYATHPPGDRVCYPTEAATYVTPELDDRWHRNASPFDVCTASLTDEASWDTALLILRTIGDSLGQHATRVLRFADWHEHDGFVTLPETTTVSDMITG